MKKVIKKVFAIATAILLTSCTSSLHESSNNQSESQNSYSTSEVQNFREFADGYKYYDFNTRYKKIKEQYPNKTILIWAVDYGVRYEEEINKYLNDKNTDYVICFKDFAYDSNKMYNDKGNWATSYAELLEREMNNHEQIDIISTGMMYANYDAFFNTYHYFSKKGWLSPINNYLETTKSGVKLYNLMPKNYWKTLELNKKIYGFDGSMSCLRYTAGYQLNASLCDDLAIDYKKISGSYTETIKTLGNISKENNLQFSIGLLENLSMYTNYDFITNCVYINDEGKIANIYESEDAKELFEEIYRQFKQGCFVNTNRTPTDLNSFLGASTYATCGEYTNNGIRTNMFYGLSSTSQSVESYKIYPEKFNTIHSSTTATGISSSSEHKDLAFDALAKIMTDEKLNNLICFGFNYSLDNDGCIQPKGYYNTMGFENKLIRKPFSGLELSNMNSLFKTAFENSKLTSDVGFYFNNEKVSKQINETEKTIISLIADFPSKKYASSENFLKTLNKALYDAGLQEVLDEANRQLEEYHNKNN